VVANTIGAGIYTTSGFTLAALGSRQAVLAVWLAASILALTGAVSYGALSRAIPESGGEYLYLSRLFHPAAGFIAGWVSLIAAFAGAEAYAAITMKAYIHWDSIPYVEDFLAVGLLITLSALHGVLIKLGTVLQNLTVLVKALFLLLFALVGAWLVGGTTDVGVIQTSPLSPWSWPVSLMWVSLSFTGFNSAIYVAEECESPRRDIPKALVVGTSVTAVLYLLVNAVILYSAPLSELSGHPEIALISAQYLGGEGMKRAVQLLVLLSLFTLISGMAVAGPRVVVKMGEDGFLPEMSLKTAALVQCGLAVVMTLSTRLADQLNYLSLTLSLTSALTVAAVFKLPPEARPHPLFPLLYLGGTLTAAAASLKTNPLSGATALATIASGGAVYFLFFRKR